MTLPEETIKELKNITNDISSILNSKEILKSDDITTIKLLYNKRKPYLQKLDEWVKSEAGTDYIQNNKAAWQQLISFFLQEDKRNLEKLADKKDEMAGELKNRFKQKSLLIYQEG